MKILLLGAGGFIGSAVAERLLIAGHRPVVAGRNVRDLARRFGGLEIRLIDLEQRQAARDWLPDLADIDVVINCVGLFSASEDRLDAIHARAPEMLAMACLAAGVKKLIHISALGAAPEAATAYWRSKGKGEEAIAALDPQAKQLSWAILRPSLVYGPGGTSAGFFASLAVSPVQFRLSDTGLVQPLAVRDLADSVVALVEREGSFALRLNAVGPEPMDLSDMLAGYRKWMGLGKALTLPLPRSVTNWLAAIGKATGSGLLTPDSIQMLRQGSHSHAGAYRRETGVTLRPLAGGLAAQGDGHRVRGEAWLTWIAPILRFSLAIMWLVTALVSAFVFPEGGGLELLAHAGVQDITLGRILLYGSSAVDALIGLALLTGWRVVLTGAVGLGLMGFFTVVISAFPELREFWSHPYGPILKNIPVAAATLAMMALYDRKGSGQ